MTLEERITTLVDWMEAAGKTVVFTGAGISTDSGLPDFRGPDGVWTRRDKGLPAHEERDWTDSSPNVAHHATVELQTLGKLDFLVSQNVDNLHLKSSIDPERLAELHGNLALDRCVRCERTYPKGKRDGCECNGALKSSIVGFGDSLPIADIEASFNRSEACDLMIVIGSSLVVTPAADVPLAAKSEGARLVIINKGETPLDTLCDLRFDESIGDVWPVAVEQLRGRLI
tara:strand:+ start:798 stop:1484 length:687 start_codon:yes stop_codon:yes gene_type:complete